MKFEISKVGIKIVTTKIGQREPCHILLDRNMQMENDYFM